MKLPPRVPIVPHMAPPPLSEAEKMVCPLWICAKAFGIAYTARVTGTTLGREDLRWPATFSHRVETSPKYWVLVDVKK
ncbi:hypothetical protein LCER1_G003829 [Lachnellula cervina]|uniref:Uncharacterized protein n=1 Tax=Lachnellula cervina TaxID=1316786 RepID=A0A7D8ZCB7_9HELO|nr:hypothetical protein LCER1_G003829 [Lachnellula cervina]